MGVLNTLCLFGLCFGVSFAFIVETENPPKRVCVIGAGIAGLSTARYLKEEGINFTVLEATRYVGGTWRYDPRTGTDENGQPLHTSMYLHQRANLPKPLIELGRFPLPDGTPSFPSWKIYLKYLNNFTKHFNITSHIKFLHNVVLVRRENNIWKVKHEHVQTGETFEEEYDFVVVGIGHFSKPNMPSIPGMDKFNGTVIHSHDYRAPDPYKDRRVLIVGGASSGMDIAVDTLTVARRVVHSHHVKVEITTKWPEHYTRKPDVKELKSNGVLFVDGSFEEVDDIIYCTGYVLHYPFLDKSSGLSVSSRSVTPLYKNAVNINQPSMVIVGLVYQACMILYIDAQARYVTAMVKGNFTLPSREEMLQDWEDNVAVMKTKGFPKFFNHVMGEREAAYYAEISKESGIYRVPPVMPKIFSWISQERYKDMFGYRNYKYTVIDNITFTSALEELPTNSLA